MTVAGKTKTMKCAYCGDVYPWNREHFPDWLMAECIFCTDRHNLTGKAKPWWAWLRSFFLRPKEAK